MFSLYTTPLSANGRKVLAVSRHLGLDPDVHLIDVYRGEGQSPAYLAVNPAGTIPCLVEDDLTLTESNAILLYLCEAHGQCRLYAESPGERAEIARWLFWESAHWQPTLVPVLSGFVGHALRPDLVPAPTDPPAWQSAALRPLLSRLDLHLQRRAWLALDTPTIADFSVAGMLTYFRAAAFPFDAYPGLRAWYARLEALEAWQTTEAPLWARSRDSISGNGDA